MFEIGREGGGGGGEARSISLWSAVEKGFFFIRFDCRMIRLYFFDPRPQSHFGPGLPFIRFFPPAVSSRVSLSIQ